MTSVHCTQSCSWRSSSVRAYDVKVWQRFWLPRFKWPPQILQWRVNSFLWWSIIIMVYNKLIYEINTRRQNFTLVQHGKQKRIRWTSGSSWILLSPNWINSCRTSFHCTQSCSWHSSSVRAYDVTVWRCFWLPRLKWPPQILQWRVNSFLWWSIIIMIYNKLIYEINIR